MRAVFVVALVFFACVSSVAARTEAEERYLFSSWVQEHGKTYESSDEMNQRFMVWKSNLAFVEKHNAEAEQGLHTYTLGMNHLADLTNHEYRKTFLTYRMTSKSAPGGIYEKSCDDADLPDSVDWRTKGVVTAVKNQGQCGSCWSFSATGSMEGAHALATGNLVSLSEQELVDCVNGGANTCSVGGEMQQGFEYAIQNGMESESDYPYCACSGNQCKFNSGEVVATFSSYQNVSSGDESALKSATANRPTVSVAIDASSMNFQLYSGGVFNYPGCSSTQLDHGVLVAGYGTYSGTDYWLVKNSWGPSWGLSGYIMMSRNANNQCGIATDASFALV